MQGCERAPLEPREAAPVVGSTARRANISAVVDIASLLDSLAVGGVYTVEPKGGYSSLRYTAMPERAVYANPIRGHPTGIQLPAGLPVRVLAEGAMVSRPTPAYTAGYCWRFGGWNSRCAVPRYTYTIHGLAPGFDVTRPYEFGTGLQVQWSRLGVRYAAPYNAPEFYGGVVPAMNPDSTGELYFRRNAACCYSPPFGDSVYTAWETYEGRWRFGAVLNDGGRAEFGEPPLLTLSGPRTDQPMTDSATFTLTAAGGGTLSEVRWWFIQPASNTFDGEPLPFVPEPFSSLMVPRYPDGQRTVITAISQCATETTCRYQAEQPGAVVAMAKMPNGDFLGARNTGSGSAPSVSLTIVLAAGPNPGGSFIVRASENVIRLEAHVTPHELAAEVEWEIEDSPDDRVNSIPPGTVPRGATSSFAVPTANINESRWPGPTQHPGALNLKALAYRITAKVTSRGQTIRSTSVTVRQDEYDTLREEYVEFGQRRVLARSELGRLGDPRRNLTGDYSVWPSAARLIERMPVLQALAQRTMGRSVTVMSGYRNPVHHFLHAGASARNSFHLYGAATDWRITDGPAGMSVRDYFLLIRRFSKDRTVDGCYEPEAMIMATSRTRTLDHGHTDWRDACPDSSW